MTREEVIKVLLQHSEHWKRLLTENICSKEEGAQTVEALNMAIKALEQEPCDDAVSRDAINNLQKYRYNCGETSITCVSLKSVNELPSVRPQEQTGHWIAVYQGDEIINYRCSKCELGDTNGSTNLYGWDYCRRCGSYNGGDNNGNE